MRMVEKLLTTLVASLAFYMLLQDARLLLEYMDIEHSGDMGMLLHIIVDACLLYFAGRRSRSLWLRPKRDDLWQLSQP